jgi:hypothetical protein
MIDGELKFPQWQAPLQDLILEFDPVKLREKSAPSKPCCSPASSNLVTEPTIRDEKIALEDALSIVRFMKRDRLACREPGPPGCHHRQGKQYSSDGHNGHSSHVFLLNCPRLQPVYTASAEATNARRSQIRPILFRCRVTRTGGTR